MTNETDALADTNRGRNWFIAASLLSFATAALHVFGGGPEIMTVVYASALPPAVAAVMDVIWQQVTALLLGGGLAMAWAARHANWRQPVAWLVGGHFAVITVIFVVWGILWFGNLLPMPQWVLFGIMAGLMALGARDHQPRTR